ncbi:L-histidine N(alpha)-methyltransferase [Fictibacillus phosphorivorans]|uniref:L-histidine N(alpha)-methyltransferase n=1 Tax=Fictibacillus phosphorivorans TaxID=1221500 RepID=UPI003CD0D8A4
MISKDFLYQSARTLSNDYPSLNVYAVSADYTAEFKLPILHSKRKVVFFPGSTIGNFVYKIAVLCGFIPRKVWCDEKEWFSMHFLEVR